MMLECNIKSRYVTLSLQCLHERTISLSTHQNITVIYIFSGYIQEEAGSPHPLASNHHHHHHPCIGL